MPQDRKTGQGAIPENNGAADVQDIEIQLLLEAVYLRYGYDFRNYSRAHLRRRVNYRLKIDGLQTVSELQSKILWSRDAFNTLLQDFSINVTEMFRDPEFYRTFREKVVPILSTYPHLKIWHAGCSTGEEVYSLAILLSEENLLNRTQVYATDFNKKVLEVAKEGIFQAKHFEAFGENYKQAGGKFQLSDYYTARYGSVKFDQSLARRIVFADHNLATDNVFAEVHLIFCRNVLIYFDKKLQSRVIGLFSGSLIPGGFLCLGTKESLRFTGKEDEFHVVDDTFRIYKKKTQPFG
ncbi:MAG TPA: protein-glutamate O-methyltransferase CheR [Prolixibacteraceae bacterium]|nr:protein-glutamate O-methyltransferase CheR [Prolixibacteraceae bacterium]